MYHSIIDAMGDFETHMRWAGGAHMVAATVLLMTILLTELPLLLSALLILGVPFTFAGASFPDIDHHASKPNRYFKLFLLGTGTLIAAYLFGIYFFESIEELILQYNMSGRPITTVTAVVFSLLVGGLVSYLFDIIRPKHRGPTHRIPIGLVVTMILIVALSFSLASAGVTVPYIIGVGIGGFFFSGFLSHLACDGMLSSPKTYISVK